VTSDSSSRKPSLYRAGVGIILLNEEDQVFIAKRIDSGGWQMPQGGIDPNETPEQAVLRELKEEIGTDNVKILEESKDWYFYDLPPYLSKHLWGGRYRGQRQKWFLLRFLGHEEDINLDTETPEFIDWKWIEVRDLPSIAVSFKKDTYENLLREFFSDLLLSNL
jgi:putative (di)nucleoside polyphosphate hydrolase